MFSEALTTTKAAAIIFLVMAWICIWVFSTLVYPEYRADALAFRLRKIRDLYFDSRLAMGAPFDLQARLTLAWLATLSNSSARISLARLALYSLAVRYSADFRREYIEFQNSSLDKDVRREVERLVGAHLTSGFPPFWLSRRIVPKWPTIELILLAASVSGDVQSASSSTPTLASL